MTHTNDELSKLRTANAELRRRLRKALDERDTMHDTLTRAQARGTELLTRARTAEQEAQLGRDLAHLLEGGTLREDDPAWFAVGALLRKMRDPKPRSS